MAVHKIDILSQAECTSGVSQQQPAEVNRVTIPCLFLVSLQYGPVVDFTTLHPFDFDRNLFNFLVVMVLN